MFLPGCLWRFSPLARIKPPIVLRACYAKPGTDLGPAGLHPSADSGTNLLARPHSSPRGESLSELRTWDAMSGPDVACAASWRSKTRASENECKRCGLQLDAPCPVLMWRDPWPFQAEVCGMGEAGGDLLRICYACHVWS
eukprot:2107588-Rhodomonas_salina.2